MSVMKQKTLMIDHIVLKVIRAQCDVTEDSDDGHLSDICMQ